MKCLVENGVDINQDGKYGSVRLACNYLIEPESNPKKICYNTPLIAACESNNYKIVKYLIEKGADVNQENKDGVTPLMTACFNGNINIVKYLVENGADINKENMYYKIMHSMYDICKDDIYEDDIYKDDIYKDDIYKDDIYEDDNDIYNLCFIAPLKVACIYGREDIVKYLIDKGANVNIKDCNYNSFNACLY